MKFESRKFVRSATPRREFFKGATTALASGMAIPAHGTVRDLLQAALFDSTNVRVVGNTPEADFGRIQDAIDSISDSSASNPYLVWVLPGVYGADFGYDQKSGIHVTLSAGVVLEATRNMVVQVSGSDNSLTGVNPVASKIVLHEHPGTRWQGGCVRTQGSRPQRFWLQDIGFEISVGDNQSGNAYAMFWYDVWGEGHSNVATIHNVLIVSNASGIYINGGYYRLRDVEIHMHGEYAHELDQVGLKQVGPARVEADHLMIYTSYGYGVPPANTSFPAREGANVFGVHVTSRAAGHTDLSNVQGLVRSNAESPGDVHWLRVEGGAVRVMGGTRVTAEKAVSDTEAIYEDGGSVSLHSVAFSGVKNGNYNGPMGVIVTDDSGVHGNHSIGTRFYIDTTAGDVTRTLNGARRSRGDCVLIKNYRGDNRVVVRTAQPGGKLNGVLDGTVTLFSGEVAEFQMVAHDDTLFGAEWEQVRFCSSTSS